jgi:hypothetical protein
MAATLNDPIQTAQVRDESERLGGQVRHFASSVQTTKTHIAETIAVNEHLYQLAAGLPGGASVAEQFAGDVARHLNGVIDQQAAEVAGYPAAQPVNFLGSAASGAADATAAREAFFGMAPPGAQRQILQTGAIVPGGQDGILVARGYIADATGGAFALEGDNRGPSNDPNASHRFAIAWDTRTGEVSITVQPSTIYSGSWLNEPATLPPPPRVTPAWPINVGSLDGNSTNNFVVDRADPGGVRLSYDLINSGLPDPARFGEVNGQVGFEVTPNEIVVNNNGENYPDREFIQYTDGGARTIATLPMSPGKDLAVFGTDIVDDTRRVPR